MSQDRAPARLRLPRIAEVAAERARLTVVPRRRSRTRRLPFALLVAAVLLGGVVGLLMFNTSMQQASFAATTLEARANALHAEQQSLQMEVDHLRDPQRVATRAQELGMVPVLHPAFLPIDGGPVLGRPVPVSRADAQRITPLPTRKPASFRPRPRVVPWDTTTGSSGAAASAGGAAAGTKTSRTR